MRSNKETLSPRYCGNCEWYEALALPGFESFGYCSFAAKHKGWLDDKNIDYNPLFIRELGDVAGVGAFTVQENCNKFQRYPGGDFGYV